MSSPDFLVNPTKTTPTTLAFIESLPLTYLHVFSFSKRPGTQAAALANGVPAPVIKNRARELRALGQKKSTAFRNEQIGSQLRVLTLRSANDLANDESRHETAPVDAKLPDKESDYTPRALQQLFASTIARLLACQSMDKCSCLGCRRERLNRRA